ncbi:hypothetical protein niasHT_010586 [Heterodera trifolii]|uniref:YitH acetyltransferase (GNAT) domain-containing protein n=1 Tax=Heterodera trifolii TaxID=157864 RepID=A0ABD2L271_9BILA
MAHWSMFYVKDLYHGHQLARLARPQSVRICRGQTRIWLCSSRNVAQIRRRIRIPSLFGLATVVIRVELKHWREASFDKLLLFDRQQTVGIDRSAYLREALRLPQSAAMVAVCRETGDVVGLCQARHLLGDRLGISLFYANSSSVASALLRAVLLQFAGPDPSAKFDSFIYKTLSTNMESVRLFHQLVQNGPVERRLFPAILALFAAFSRPSHLFDLR